MKLVGYTITGQDNDSYMFRDNSALNRCTVCGYRLDFSQTNPDYTLTKCSAHISATYDGQTIVSKKFKEFCELNEYRRIRFGSFENDSNHFHLVLTRKIKFDAVRRGTRFERLCPQCGNHGAVAGATPAYVFVDESLADGFYRTDLIFGSGNEKAPLNLLGSETRAKLIAAGLGLEDVDFHPAYACGDVPVKPVSGIP